MNYPRLLLSGLLLTLLVFVMACGGGGSAAPDPSPAATEAAPGPTATTTIAAGDVPTRPGPEPGVACPIALMLCEFAVQMETIVLAGDVDAFFAVASLVPVTCPGSTSPDGVTPGVCEGASAGEVRSSYWALQGGEALRASEQELRGAMMRWFDAVARASAAGDAYGPGNVRIGSISCTRRPEAKSGDCIGNSIQVHFTFINPPDSQNTGVPGRRTTFHVSAGVVDGVPRPNGFGVVSPPNRPLLPSVINVQDGQGNPLLVEVYPWTH